MWPFPLFAGSWYHNPVCFLQSAGDGITFGRWDDNNPMVLAPEPLKENRYHVVAGRMGAGTKEVRIEVFINKPQPMASKPFPVNPAANSSKLAIGQERDATNHPGRESFDGEIARFLVYERPLTNDELEKVLSHLKKKYAIPQETPSRQD